MWSHRVILHADMDAFYASVEQRDRPELRGKPVIVGGTSPRGVVSAASYEARRFGVRSAMPAVEARARCPEGVFLPGDMAKYRRVSRDVFTVFETITPLVEPLSLDEAFLDVTASTTLLGDPVTIAHLVRARVREATALAVSVGIGPTKMVAKIASDAAKPDGLLEVPPEGVRAFLAPLPVERLWGIGPVAQRRLDAAGIRTIGDLTARAPSELGRYLGPGADHWIALARGDDARAVEPDRDAKSYGEEHTFARDVSDDDLVRRAIIAHADAVARRLRRDAMHAGCVVLKVKLARRLGGGKFPLLTRRTTLPAPTDDGKTLSDAALDLWNRHRPREPIRLIGVAAASLAPRSSAQLGLFGRDDTGKRTALNAALDRIVDRFGEGAIGRVPTPRRAGLTTRVKRGE